MVVSVTGKTFYKKIPEKVPTIRKVIKMDQPLQMELQVEFLYFLSSSLTFYYFIVNV